MLTTSYVSKLSKCARLKFSDCLGFAFTCVPRLEQNLRPFSLLVNGIRHQSPSLSVVVINHEGALVPVTTGPVDESTLVYDESYAVPCPVGIVFDLGGTGLEVIDASVSSHRPHDNTVSQRQLSTDNNWFEKAGHDEGGAGLRVGKVIGTAAWKEGCTEKDFPLCFLNDILLSLKKETQTWYLSQAYGHNWRFIL